MNNSDDLMKIVVGNKNKIPSSLANNVIDGNDVVITDDSHEMIYIDKKKDAHPIVSRNRCFSDIASATEALNASTDTYAGQIVMISDGTGIYNIFTVQKNNGFGWKVQPVQGSSQKLQWKHF